MCGQESPLLQGNKTRGDSCCNNRVHFIQVSNHETSSPSSSLTFIFKRKDITFPRYYKGACVAKEEVGKEG